MHPFAYQNHSDFPEGPVPIDCPLYIERPPLEEMAYAEIEKPGSVTRIKAPRQTGKSSLLIRILDRARWLGYYTACLDFHQADKAIFRDLDKFLRWFCANISHQLQIPIQLNEYWDEDIGSKISCTLYLQGYLLANLDAPLCLTLNEVNRVFEYPDIAQEFLPLLRSWHEEAKQSPPLQKMRLVVVHSTEVYIPLNLHQSPFNVGLPLTLPEFTPEQVEDLVARQGLSWNSRQCRQRVERLMELVGGHPYRIRLALYCLYQGHLDFEALMKTAATEAGIYRDRLRGFLSILRERPQLARTLKRVVTSSEPVPLEPIAAYQLESMGVVTLQGSYAQPSCELYRQYFAKQNLESDSINRKLEELEKANRTLQNLVRVDELTQVANRRCFEEYLSREWQRSAQDKTPIAIVMCDVDRFKSYNDTYGHQRGDLCLQQIAKAIEETTQRSSDLVARYGGEEFTIILPQTDAKGAQEVAQKVRHRVRSLAIAHESVPYGAAIVTLSLGVASAVADAKFDAFTVVQAADRALYASKSQGRDRVTLSDTCNFYYNSQS
ncbi:AAA-like domain-containing protein [Geitlerinema sp. PCC 9228]|uniref:AAA-like domain-containing protein n=1 Tax=Geitlerinema sp. PCC 9228 TaxID=111611 RepID=UPI0008F9E364|nr:AAA-like domain-containing protein [Geitlerinema sp. PCC 9228]